jgi:hypothetical protein
MTPAAYIHAAGALGPSATPIVHGATGVALTHDAQPVALRTLAKEIIGQTPRLMSRFAELALLGSQLCLRELRVPLANDARVYLGTGLGDVARTDALYYQVMPPSSEMASPAHFATSGNNMAAFFVAQRAALASRNLTFSAEELSFETSLAFALVDLRAAATGCALVGGVDETTLPREFYVRRFPLATDALIGEGSAWLALSSRREHAIAEVLAATIFDTTAAANMREWAQCTIQAVAPYASRATILPGCRMEAEEIAALRAALPTSKIRPYLRLTGLYPTAAALAIVQTLQPGAASGVAAHINRDRFGKTGVIVVRSLRSSPA